MPDPSSYASVDAPLDRRDHVEYSRGGRDLVTRNIAPPAAAAIAVAAKVPSSRSDSPTPEFPRRNPYCSAPSDGPSGVYKVFYVAQQTKPVKGVLTKIVSWIDQNRVTRDPRCKRAFCRRGDFGDHIVTTPRSDTP